jgi:hypothetical protein
MDNVVRLHLEAAMGSAEVLRRREDLTAETQAGTAR